MTIYSLILTTMTQHVIIASKNPVKINATSIWFESMFPDQLFDFQWISVPSWVSDQPMSNQETFQWAKNRAENAKKEKPDADFRVWLEGWVEKTDHGREASARIYIVGKNSKWRETVGKWKTGTFILPQKVSDLIEQWNELGKAQDIVFSKHNSKQKSWSVWLLTNDIFTRSSFYGHATILGLIPFKNPELY